MSPWLFARIERLLERGVRESATAAALAAQLDGAGFRVQVEGLGADVVLRSEGGRIRVVSGRDARADATVRGTPLDLLRVFGPAGAGDASRLPGSGVTLSGRIHVAEQFAELLRIATPDPEEELSRWVGDLLAHRAANAARNARAWTLRVLDALTADTAEYFTEEGRVLPTRYETDALFAAIERLRDDVERAEARIERLAARHGFSRRRPTAVDVEAP